MQEMSHHMPRAGHLGSALALLQVYEGQAEIAEAREEAEMLRIKLEAAMQEAENARKQTAAAQSGLAAALASQASITSRDASPVQPSSADVSTLAGKQGPAGIQYDVAIKRSHITIELMRLCQ